MKHIKWKISFANLNQLSFLGSNETPTQPKQEQKILKLLWGCIPVQKSCPNSHVGLGRGTWNFKNVLKKNSWMPVEAISQVARPSLPHLHTCGIDMAWRGAVIARVPHEPLEGAQNESHQSALHPSVIPLSPLVSCMWCVHYRIIYAPDTQYIYSMLSSGWGI